MTTTYKAPGGADELSPALARAWNAAVGRARKDGLSDFPADRPAGRFLLARPPAVADRAAVTWSPVPRQVRLCLGREDGRRLCDAARLPGEDDDLAPPTLAGGREWHNEYCEYRVIMGVDAAGRERPKRVEITTELREFWLTVARTDPDRLVAMATGVLCAEENPGTPEPTLLDLYGPDGPADSPGKREEQFVEQCAGSATRGDRRAPRGAANRSRALFMAHPINGLDDLYFILAFGAQPYARLVGGDRRPVPPPWSYLDSPYFNGDPAALAQLRDTYCRHADPAASQAAYAAVYAGRRLALADPPGVYMRPADFDAGALRYRGEPIEARGWVRWRRPAAGPRHQRLVIGPPDGEADAFLDDIVVCRGAREVPLTGGYQILELLAVGPDVLVEREPQPIDDADWMYLDPHGTQIRCGMPRCEVCRELAPWRSRLGPDPLEGRPLEGRALAAPRWWVRPGRSSPTPDPAVLPGVTR